MLDVDPAKVVSKGRLQPGRMFLIDTREGRIVDDEEIKKQLAAEHPYGEWLARRHGAAVRPARARARRVQPRQRAAPPADVRVHPRGAEDHRRPDGEGGRRADRIDGHRHADRRVVEAAAAAVRLLPAAVRAGHEPAARRHPRGGRDGGRRPRSAPRRTCSCPAPTAAANWRCRSRSSTTTSSPRSSTPTTTASSRAWQRTSCRVCTASPVAARRCAQALDRIVDEVSSAIERGARVIVLSDRNADSVDAPIPSLLLTAAVHHHLVRTKQRTKVGLVVECGDAREVHHMALLIGYGAGAINPYLAFESIEDLIAEGMHGLAGIDPHKAVKNYIKACGKGVLKVMSKMGVSTVASYTGAQIFEAIGLGDELVDRYFTGTVSRIGGIDLDEIATGGRRAPRGRQPAAPRRAGPPQARARRRVPVAPRGRVPPLQPGDRVQAPARHASQALRHLQGVQPQGRRPVAQPGDAARAVPVPTTTASRSPSTRSSRSSEIVRRFSTGAMSYGSISAEAHETLAIAMNRIGAKSNTGEGGEDADRLHDPDAPIGDQAGGIGPLRRHVRVPHQRRRPADQDGPGRQARRGRPAARPQGVPVDRQDPLLDAGRRTDQPTTAPRHLFDRGSQAADPRPQELEPVGADPRQARRRDGRRHRGRRRVEGQGRRRADLRSRRRHRRLAADVAQARRWPVGAGARRDAADARAQRVARPHRRADRRPAQDGP